MNKISTRSIIFTIVKATLAVLRKICIVVMKLEFDIEEIVVSEEISIVNDVTNDVTNRANDVTN
jgi:hypothetical protein